MKTTHFRIFYLSIINSVGEDRKSKYFRIIHNLHSIREKRNGSRRIKALTRVSLTLYRNTCECLLQIKIMRERQEKSGIITNAEIRSRNFSILIPAFVTYDRQVCNYLLCFQANDYLLLLIAILNVIQYRKLHYRYYIITYNYNYITNNYILHYIYIRFVLQTIILFNFY